MFKKAIRRPLSFACVLAALAMLLASGPANALVHVYIIAQDQWSPVQNVNYSYRNSIYFNAHVAISMDRFGSAWGYETGWCQGSTGYGGPVGTPVNLVKAAPASSFSWQNGDFSVRNYNMNFSAYTYIRTPGDYYTACVAQYRTTTTGGIITVIKRASRPFHVLPI